MTKNEKRVLELINIKKNISITGLCETLGISGSTARRALTALEKTKRIACYHGGALSLAAADTQSNIQKRMDVNASLKDKIARTAAERIRPGQTVMLTGGTTVYLMCKYILSLSIAVITNSLIVADELKSAPNIELILLGGRYNRAEMEMEGALTNFNLKLLKTDCMFLGTNGFNPHYGFLTDRIEALELYRLCAEASTEKYVLADSSKLNGRGSAVIATCEMINYVVTDAGVGRDVADQFTEKGIKIIYC